jgi:uncharacterized protein (DUF1800 family)
LLVLAAGVLASVPPASALTLAAALGVYRPTVGKFFVDGNYDSQADLKVVFGTPGDVGMMADIKGSGSKVPVTFNGGVWKFDNNRDGTADVVINFGAPGDIGLVGDTTGSGKDDLVLYRGGLWYVSSTGTGTVTAIYGFGGVAGDIPLLADVDGDGKADLIIYRGGLWYVSTNRNGNANLLFGFGGGASDIPIAFDYNGDGKAELGVFRDGVWYVAVTPPASQLGLPAAAVFGFGAPGDKPLYAGPGASTTTFLDAARFLTHASFGPVPAEITAAAGGCATPNMTPCFSAYIDAQFAKPATTLPAMAYAPQNQPQNCTSPLTAGGPADPFGTNCPRDIYTQFVSQRYFFKNALTAPDQLRQRVAWALSQIVVVSAANDPIGYANRNYQQMLQDLAFDNYYNILFRASVDPLMGNYLDMVNNAKADPVKGTQPNENYAREIMQLFSIGLWELNNDGTLLLDASLNPIPTYTQLEVTDISRLFTGWTYWPLSGGVKWNSPVNYLYNMTPCEGAATPCTTNPAGTNYHDNLAPGVNVLGKTFLTGQTADTDLRQAVDLLFAHPNLGPSIGKQLIQHLVTSNPSPAYVNRVANAFNNNGSGIRGDMKAVIKAVLLDPEAQAPRNPVYSSFGKLKEPVLLVTNFLRAMSANSDGVYPLLQTPNMDQNVYTSPTVFNYYPADYVIPGTSLAGPQFGIFNATTYFPRANFMYNLTIGAGCAGVALPPANILCGPNADATVTGSTGTKIDYGQLTPFANNTANLVQQVNNMLLYGTMPVGMKQQIAAAVDAVAPGPAFNAQQLLDRARAAVYLTVVSPKYQLEF